MCCGVCMCVFACFIVVSAVGATTEFLTAGFSPCSHQTQPDCRSSSMTVRVSTLSGTGRRRLAPQQENALSRNWMFDVRMLGFGSFLPLSTCACV